MNVAMKVRLYCLIAIGLLANAFALPASAQTPTIHNCGKVITSFSQGSTTYKCGTIELQVNFSVTVKLTWYCTPSRENPGCQPHATPIVNFGMKARRITPSGASRVAVSKAFTINPDYACNLNPTSSSWVSCSMGSTIPQKIQMVGVWY